MALGAFKGVEALSNYAILLLLTYLTINLKMRLPEHVRTFLFNLRPRDKNASIGNADGDGHLSPKAVLK